MALPRRSCQLLLIFLKIHMYTDTSVDGRGSYYYMGGLLMIIGGLLEWVLGNTFPFLVFCAYGMLPHRIKDFGLSM